eukprot:Hpha_TRINITY_DN3016_c0_g1::TRINITY_DN3016_c0_g1_i1::g.138554::m.138554
MGPEEIMEAVRQWWVDEDCLCPVPMEEEIKEFCMKHMDMFPSPPEGSPESFVPEQTVEMTEVYDRFKEMLETRLESFLKAKDITSEEFLEACAHEQQKLREFETGPQHWLCALSDYRTFYRAMQEVKGEE